MLVPLIKYREEIEDISITAQKERDIESKLLTIELAWRQREFKFATFKNRGELLLRGQETSEILAAIDDSNLILAALASNRYNVFFKSQIQKYIADLAISAEILSKWMQVQNLWIYLGKIAHAWRRARGSMQYSRSGICRWWHSQANAARSSTIRQRG